FGAVVVGSFSSDARNEFVNYVSRIVPQKLEGYRIIRVQVRPGKRGDLGHVLHTFRNSTMKTEVIVYNNRIGHCLEKLLEFLVATLAKFLRHLVSESVVGICQRALVIPSEHYCSVRIFQKC